MHVGPECGFMPAMGLLAIFFLVLLAGMSLCVIVRHMRMTDDRRHTLRISRFGWYYRVTVAWLVFVSCSLALLCYLVMSVGHVIWRLLIRWLLG